MSNAVGLALLVLLATAYLGVEAIIARALRRSRFLDPKPARTRFIKELRRIISRRSA